MSVRCYLERRAVRPEPTGSARKPRRGIGGVTVYRGVQRFSLRRAMILEWITLTALINPIPETAAVPRPKELQEAIEGRIDRLKKLKHAAVEIATIGEFYQLRRRSSIASYVGVTCAAVGTFCLVAALGMAHF